MVISSTEQTRLYAFLLKLRPLQEGTLMPFAGELVQGAFLNWLRAAAPDVATWLHEGQKRRLFTCSSLHFSLPTQRLLEAERENTHLPLDPQKIYTVRITLLLGDLFPLFYNALMQFNTSETVATQPPFFKLGKQLFLLEEVVLANDDPSGWTGFTTLQSLVEKVKLLELGNTASLVLEFASLTTFNRSKKEGYGMHYFMLPLPEYVFQNLFRRWEDVASAELVGMVQGERIERYIKDGGMFVIDYDLRAHHVRFTTHTQRGFIGRCKYQLRGPDEIPTEEAPLTVRQQLFLLAQLGFYSGVGYKTATGLGQMRLVEGCAGRDDHV